MENWMKIIRTQTNIQRHKSATKTLRKTKNENGISFGREGEKEERERERKFELVWNFFWFRRLPVVMCSILKTTYLDICVFFV